MFTKGGLVGERHSIQKSLKAPSLKKEIDASLRRLEVDTIDYSLLSREVEKEILPFALPNGMGVIVDSPMASGLLSGAMTRQRINDFPPDDWRRSKSPWFKEPALTWNLNLADLLKDIGRQQGYRMASSVLPTSSSAMPATPVSRPISPSAPRPPRSQPSDEEAADWQGPGPASVS